MAARAAKTNARSPSSPTHPRGPTPDSLPILRRLRHGQQLRSLLRAGGGLTALKDRGSRLLDALA